MSNHLVSENSPYLLQHANNPVDCHPWGEEGKFYVWTQDEIEEVLDSDFDFFKTAYGITPSGNWEGKTILQCALDDSTLTARFKSDQKELQQNLPKCYAKLLEVRSSRIRPATDDKVLVMWNSLMLKAFAEAGRYLNRQDYLQVAICNARFLLDNLYVKGRLHRSWREGQAKHNAYLEDYAGLILALLALYQSDPNKEWYLSALKLADEMVEHFFDPNGGFFDTRYDYETLLVRPKDIQDSATPSGNALAVAALLELAAYGADGMARSCRGDAFLSIWSDATLSDCLCAIVVCCRFGCRSNS